MALMERWMIHYQDNEQINVIQTHMKKEIYYNAKNVFPFTSHEDKEGGGEAHSGFTLPIIITVDLGLCSAHFMICSTL